LPALSLAAFFCAAQSRIFQWKSINPDDPSQGNRQRSPHASSNWKLAPLATVAALLVAGQLLAAETVLKPGPGGSASLVNSSLDTSIVLKSYSIIRREPGVELLPAGWDSLHLQGNLFSETSATVDVLSEAAVADGLLFGPGQSRSIGVPFNLRADADGNGTIDLSDFVTWKSHQGQHLEGPGVGDFDSNGVVDLVDFELLLNEMGNSAVYTFAVIIAVPEPGASILLFLGLVPWVTMRRRMYRRSTRLLKYAVRLLPLMAYACAARPELFSWHRREIHEALRREGETLIRRNQE
jgi:hypothetical protein